MPLSSDPVPARFNPLGVEGAHRVVRSLHGRLSVSQVELRLPVRSLGRSKLLLRYSQLTKWFRFKVGRSRGLFGLHRRTVGHLDDFDGPTAASDTLLPPCFQLVFDWRSLDLSRCFVRYLNSPQSNS